jgi:predicted membrane protein
MNPKVFWGVVIVFIGLYMIFNGLFKFNFPVFKIILSVVIIYFGFKLLFGSFGKNNFDKPGEYNAVFSSRNFNVSNISENSEFNIVFGNSRIDLRNTGFNKSDLDLEINSVFGNTTVFLPKTVDCKIKGSAVFGSVITPDGSMASFGDTKYLNEQNHSTKLNIEANAVFGRVELIQ